MIQGVDNLVIYVRIKNERKKKLKTVSDLLYFRFLFLIYKIYCKTVVTC